MAGAGGFSRMPDGVCGTIGLASTGGRDDSVAALAGGVMRGEATGLGAGLYRGAGFSTASVGWVEPGRAGGVFIGVGRMRRGVVCGTRAGVAGVVGTAGVVRGAAMASGDAAGKTIGAGDGFMGVTGCRGRTEGEGIAGVDITGAVAGAVGGAVGDNAGLGVARAVGAGIGDAGFGVDFAVGAGVGDADTGGVGVEIVAGVARAVGAEIGVAETAVAGVVTGLALIRGGLVVWVPEGPEGSGFTNVFEGASGGGVDSAFIFARARSAAGRSVSADQLFSTLV